ncbi:phosphoribosylamine--glycine ligase [Novimethylophilus kurashikiensis]|uniref:Phosphoribosylamine--glycine ligase n=1 Tax=Novimethylophilus kurashikiensis TaxID=1825523 RepID=A0A2R5F845_9PROT|nr:hypothetical protein [Novimethylophilus kurashikiensis]GBG14367.1 phosphoribosylamine--glycine ligase [Novimethylophilus kurashikiensis]
MLSSMETPMGLTVIGPSGRPLRVPRNSPAFQSSKDLLGQAMPAEQVWVKLQDLAANPLQAFSSWCNKFGVKFTDEGENFRLQDISLGKASWMPLLQRGMAAGASLAPFLRLAERLGGAAATAKVEQVCLHWQEIAIDTFRLGLVTSQMLPAEARIGDKVVGKPSGPQFGLVSYDGFTFVDGSIRLDEGVVIGTFGADSALVEEVLAEPVILGFNQTYRCEEGTADGWLEDLSFDSLKAARLNAEEIRKSGSSVRIINRVSGDVVAL